LNSLYGCMQETFTPATGLAWRLADESLKGTDDESKLSPDQREDPSTAPGGQSEPAAPGRYQILIVEDNRADLFLIREAIKQSQLESELQFATDGEKAVQLIAAADSDEANSTPDLILLDLNLPRRNGAEVLQYVRRSNRCSGVPVLIVSSSDSEEDRADAARFGASGYFKKPSSYAGFMKLGSVIRELLSANPAGDKQ